MQNGAFRNRGTNRTPSCDLANAKRSTGVCQSRELVCLEIALERLIFIQRQNSRIIREEVQGRKLRAITKAKKQ